MCSQNVLWPYKSGLFWTMNVHCSVFTFLDYERALFSVYFSGLWTCTVQCLLFWTTNVHCSVFTFLDYERALFRAYFFLSWMQMQCVPAPSYVHRLPAQVIVLSFQVERGILIFHALQILIWFMTVAKTYPRVFISDLFFLRNMAYKAESLLIF